MQKVAVLTTRDKREEVIECLYDEGVLEVHEATKPSQFEHTEVDFQSGEIDYAVTTLKEVANKETLIAADKPCSNEEIIAAAKHTNVRGVVDSLRKLEEDDTILERELQEILATQLQLRPWSALRSDLGTPSVSTTTVRIRGHLPEANAAMLQSTLQKDLPRTLLEEGGTEAGEAYFVVTVWKDDQLRFEEIATGLGWTSVDMPQLSGTASALYEEACATEREILQKKQKNHQERVRLSVELPNLRKVQNFLHWLNEKQSIREAATETDSTFVLFGWMPKKRVDLLESRLQKITSAIAVLRVKPDADEQPPVQLKNRRFVTPFQSVTTLYGLPQFSEFDPTSSLAPFFALFFALCLTDAGYGLVLAIVFGIVLAKKRLTAEQAPLLWTLCIGGIITFFVGILFGGWFGLSPDQAPEVLTYETADGSRFFLGQLWNLSQRDGIMFLLYLSLILGITHIFFGMFLAGWHKWVHDQKLAAFWLDFTSHLLLGGGLFYAISAYIYPQLETVAFWTFMVSIVLFVWGKGHGFAWYLRPAVGLLGVVTFAINILSNGLSYLRILALGLVTGSLASAVNQVATALGNLFPIWASIPIIIIIFVGGHLVSIALNTLGTFIHAGRLQFIEFFGQFFEGGGRTFAPFRRSRL